MQSKSEKENSRHDDPTKSATTFSYHVESKWEKTSNRKNPDGDSGKGSKSKDTKEFTDTVRILLKF